MIYRLIYRPAAARALELMSREDRDRIRAGLERMASKAERISTAFES